MCSNTEIEDGAMLMEALDKFDLTGSLCKKCGNENKPQIVLRKKDAYCKSCFLTSVKHKFRACLGKSKKMKPGDKVLVAFSGSSNSVAMLHLIQSGLQETSHKRLMFHPTIVYIDEYSALNLSEEESKTIKEDIQRTWGLYEYPKHIVPLHLSIEEEETVNAFLTKGTSTDKTKFINMFTSLPENTSKIDMLNKLRSNLLAQIARLLGCNKIFTAETANDLAVKLITNVSLGRGAQLPYDVGFSDDRYAEVKVIRPMRDLSKKELVFYNVFHDLIPAHVPSLLTKAEPHSSIHRLTESFLTDLQDGFPSTLSTVFRVADKLTTNPEDKIICPLCQAPVDTDKVPSSSLSATQFSRIVSHAGPSKLDASSLEATCNLGSEQCCNGGGDQSCRNKASEPSLQNLLCYGCNLIVRNADVAKFPNEVKRSLQEASQRFQMRKEIEHFLL
ncbi:cytoplasmic tRNA 2-thiolation protein 2-B [Macrosteles quadrilineatus]|uniref:cytoplasmic tRNA 2-thiolation protein 2-B n=1 Tax=Macrosteles quadrilineatus TaxID=74068 RepID=UPI0023E1B3AA|nr:cytoplasmic tRNA 2-thiolation protein 2-B [Macrosteles quadrilineatus]